MNGVVWILIKASNYAIISTNIRSYPLIWQLKGLFETKLANEAIREEFHHMKLGDDEV